MPYRFFNYRYRTLYDQLQYNKKKKKKITIKKEDKKIKTKQ